MTDYQTELNKVLRALPERERDLVEGAFKLGWDAAINKAVIRTFDSDYTIDRPREVLEYGRSLRDKISKMYSWEEE